MVIDWKDITSYSQHGDKNPRWWQVKLSTLRISVGNHHVYYPDGKTWLMNCEPWYKTHELKAKDEVSAKREAMDLVRERVDEIMRALSAQEGK